MNTEIRIKVYHNEEQRQYSFGYNISEVEYAQRYRRPEEHPHINEMPPDRAVFEYERFKEQLRQWESNIEHLAKEIAIALTSKL